MRRKNKWMVIATLVLTACAVGPDFHPPESPAAEHYLAADEAVSNDQKLALGQHLSAEWWTVFNVPALNQTITEALAHNNGLAAAQARLSAARETVAAANGGLLPQLGVDANVSRQKYGVALFGPSNFTIPPFTAYQIGPNVSWTLDLFGGQRREIERRQALAEYQAQQLNAAYIALTGNVVAQALTLAAVDAEIAATKRVIAEEATTLKLVNATVAAGTGTKVETLSAESQWHNLETLLPPLEQQASVARHALAVLVGMAPADYTPPMLTLQQFTLPRRIPASYPSELVHQRPDILAAEANMHATSAAIGVATANLYPKLTLSANTTQQALAVSDLFHGANNAWALAAGLAAPIYSGGTLTAEKRAAEQAYQAALADYRNTVLVAFGQVADALQALSHDGQEIAVQQKAVDTAQASLALSRKSYHAGNTGLLQIQESQRHYTQARIGLIRAQGRRYLDTVQLFIALGGSPYAGTGDDRFSSPNADRL